MNVSTLNDSFRFSFDMNLEGCVEAIAEAASSAAFNATKHFLDRAIADTRSLICAERTAKEAIWKVVFTSVQITEAVVNATDVRIDTVIDDKIITPATQAKTKITTPVSKAWNLALDGITDYLEFTPIKTAKVTESFPIQVNQVAEAIADYTKIEEVEVDAQDVDPITTQNEINAVLIEEKPQVIGGSLVSSAGVTPAMVFDRPMSYGQQATAIAFNEDTLEKGHKAAQSLTEMIKEEATKHG